MLSLTFAVHFFYNYYIGQFEQTPQKSQSVSSKSKQMVEEKIVSSKHQNLECENHKTGSGFPRKSQVEAENANK